MPQSCHVVGCSNRKMKGTKLSFYPIPFETTAFEKKRKEDWLRRIGRKDWNDKNEWPHERISKQRGLWSALIVRLVN